MIQEPLHLATAPALSRPSRQDFHPHDLQIWPRNPGTKQNSSWWIPHEPDMLTLFGMLHVDIYASIHAIMCVYISKYVNMRGTKTSLSLRPAGDIAKIELFHMSV